MSRNILQAQIQSESCLRINVLLLLGTPVGGGTGVMVVKGSSDEPKKIRV